MPCSRRSYSREVSLASTVPADDAVGIFGDLYSYFYPMNPILRAQVDVKQGELAPITFGRHQDNCVVLNDTRGRIAPHQCVVYFRWDEATSTLETTLKSLTQAGVYVDDIEICKGHSCILRNGATIRFVSFDTDHNNFTYIYHVIASSNRSAFTENYQVCEPISQGKFNEVHKAIDTVTQEVYAVKIVSCEKMHPIDAEFSRKCMLKEVEVMSGLKHPNVCKLVDAFTSEEKIIQIVMEFLPHGSLLDYAVNYSGSAQGGLAELVTRDVMYQICDATLYLHSKMIVHRDLNPMNILVAQKHPLVVKICDFDRAQQNKMFHKTCVGTPYYAAPELSITNRRKTAKGYTRKVDSYSIGCIAFFLMTLSHPFVPGTEHVHSLEMHIQRRKTDWSPLNPWKGTEVYNFIVGLLKEQPWSRLDMRAAKNHKWFDNYEPQHVPRIDEYEDGFGPASGLYRLSPQKRSALQPIMEVSEDDTDDDMEPFGLYERSVDSMDFSEGPLESDIEYGQPEDIEMVSASPAVPAQDSVSLAQRRSPRRNRGQHPNRIKSRYLY